MKQIMVLALACSACAFVAEGTGESSSESSSGSSETTIADQSTTTTAATTASSVTSASTNTDASSEGTSSSASGNDGETDDASSTGDTVVDYALAFTGAGGAQLLELDALPPAYTIEYWLHVDGTMHGTHVSTFTGGHGWWFFHEQGEWTDYDDVLVYIDYSASDWDYVVGDPARDLNEDPGWHHVASTKDPDGVVRLYIDGDLIDERQFTTPFDTMSSPLWIGINDVGGLPLSGALIDDVAISRVVRYDAPFVPAKDIDVDPDTLIAWDFNEGQGDAAYDLVEGAALVLSGAAWQALPE